MSEFAKCTSRTIKTLGWRLALPLALLASSFTPVAAQAKVNEVSSVSRHWFRRMGQKNLYCI